MSAYSDWKAGALTDDEYRSAMRRECEDHYPDVIGIVHQCCECIYCNQATIRKRKAKLSKGAEYDENGNEVCRFYEDGKDRLFVIESNSETEQIDICTCDGAKKYLMEIDSADEQCRDFEGIDDGN